MTITVTAPAAVGGLGPGQSLLLHSDLIGPISTTWAWRARPTLASGQVLASAVIKATGNHDQGLVLGVFNYPGLSLRTPEPNTLAAPGTALTLNLDIVQSNFFTVEDTGTIAGWSWDPVSGLYALIMDWIGSSGGSVSAEILAAVKQTF